MIKKNKTIAIVGSRRRCSQKDFEHLKDVFFEIYKDGDKIVSGGCPKGADRFAEIIAKTYQIPIMIYYANWNKYGKMAGFKRNTNIAEDADIVIAMVAHDRTGGTEDTVKKAKHMEKEIVLLEVDNTKENDKTEDNKIEYDTIKDFDPFQEGF